MLIWIYEVFATEVAALFEIYEMPTRVHYLSSINHEIHFYHGTTCHKPDHMLLLPPSQRRTIGSGHLFTVIPGQRLGSCALFCHIGIIG